MKSLFAKLVYLTFFIQSAVATPDHSITVDEKLLGSNPNGFAIIRTEYDNMGSYFITVTSIYLDEYKKLEDAAELTTSTLLLRERSIIDAGHNDRNTPPPVTKTLEEKDDSLTLGKVVSKYPPLTATTWKPELFSRLTFDQKGGVYFDNKLNIIWGGDIIKKAYNGSETTWSLSEVLEDKGCLFLRFGTPGRDQNNTSRLVFIPEKRSRQVRDWAERKDIYLSLGTFNTLEEAKTESTRIREAARHHKCYGIELEIWSTQLPTDAVVYHLVDRNSEQAIKKESFKKWERLFLINVSPISGERLQERFEPR